MSDKRKDLTVKGVPLTDDDIGRRVRFQTYEGYQNTQTLKGEGEIKSIDWTYGQVHISTGKFRTIYFRGYSSGQSDVVTMHGEYDHKTGNVELHRGEYSAWQLDMPTKFEKIFEFVDDE